MMMLRIGTLIVVGLSVVVQGCRTAGDSGVVDEGLLVVEAEEEEVVEVVEQVSQTVVVGHIVSVAADNRWVMVQLVPGQEVRTGTVLSARSGGQEVARLRVTPEGQEGFITPDVILGVPREGNQVVRVVE